MEFTNPLPFRHQRDPRPLQIQDATALVDDDSSSASSRSAPILPRPRSPLPPHKLASIANALGVSTPMPAFYRAPSPAASSPNVRAPSRFLLHVVPPPFLPHEDDEDDDNVGLDPEGTKSVSASAYRSQFRRGTLIPLYPSLQSQLGAIAREFSLPSTGGLVLYLLHSSAGPASDGPRISDDVWKLLWHKALRAERADAHAQLRTKPSLDFRSGRSTPSSPFTSPQTSSPFSYPSPSSASEAHLPLPTSTPDPLADLTPTPFLPILAKVEFDIDRRKASWFDAWAHTKRERARWRTAGTRPLALPARADADRRFLRPSHDTSPDSSEYAVLDDGEGEKTAVDDDGDEQDTIVLPRDRERDPLADVFGADDAATWRDLQAARGHKPKSSTEPDLIIPPGNEDQDAEEHRADDTAEVMRLWEQNRRPTLPLSTPRKGAPAPLILAPTAKEPLDPLASPQPPTTANSFLPYLHGLSPLESESGSSSSEVSHAKKTRRRTGMVFGDLRVEVAEPDDMSDASHRSSQVLMKHKLDQLEKQLAVLSPRQFDKRSPQDFDPTDLDRAMRSAPPGANHFIITPPRQRGASTSSPGWPLGDAFPVPPRKDSLAHRKNQGSGSSSKMLAEDKAHKRGQGSSSGSSFREQSWSAVPHISKPQPPIPPSPPAPTPRSVPPHLTLQRASKVDLSEETRARSSSGSGDGQDVLLPPAPITSHHSGSSSPVIPLSPDPFGYRPAEPPESSRPSESSTTTPTNAANTTTATPSRPPSRAQGTVLPAAVPEDSATDDAQSSRFSMDSEQGVEQLSRSRRSIMSVRGLRSLWRKSAAAAVAKPAAVPPLPVAASSPDVPMSPQRPQHARVESSTSSKRRGARPDSGADPFQFDNAERYKASTGPTPNYAAAGGSIGQAKGILKGWTGNANPSDAEARRMRRPSLATVRRSMSTTSTSVSASASMSDLGERTQSPATPPDVRRESRRHKAVPSLDPEPVMMLSHSLPSGAAGVAGGLSRYPASLPSSSSLSMSIDDDGATPRLAEFEMIAPPQRRRAPSTTY